MNKLNLRYRQYSILETITINHFALMFKPRTPQSRGAGITAAADTGLAPRLLPRLLTAGNSPLIGGTRGDPVTVSRIAEVSRLVRPVGPGPLSQCPSGGSRSHGPYPSSAWRAVTPPTT